MVFVMYVHIPGRFNTEIFYPFFSHKIALGNSQQAHTNSKGYLVPKK